MSGTEPTPAEALRLERPAEHPGEPIDCLLRRDSDSRALLVLGHGAGAGMEHPHLDRLSSRLLEEGIATLRYQFPYRQMGRGRPDRPPVLEATVRAVVLGADHTEAGHLPRFLGGRSMGARMALRTVVADERSVPVLSIAGLALFAYPLHRALRVRDADPDELPRAEMLLRLRTPALFLSGTRDTLARRHLLAPLVDELAGHGAADIHWIVDADHSFKTLSRAGRTLADVEAELARVTAAWICQRLDG